jgi:hypothetical protein
MKTTPPGSGDTASIPGTAALFDRQHNRPGANRVYEGKERILD